MHFRLYEHIEVPEESALIMIKDKDSTTCITLQSIRNTNKPKANFKTHVF